MGQISRILGRFRLLSGQKDPFDGLHSVERMRAILQRERMRSDRGCSHFALLTLALPERREPHQFAALARVIRERTRETDDAGFLGPCSLGVVLPETPADGAWKLAADLRALWPAEVPEPKCDVYLYPTASDGDGAETVEAATNGYASNGHTPTNGSAAPPSQRRGARPMHAFFLQPLPLWKRGVDVAIAGTALFVASPLLLLIALTIRLTSGRPIIYAQQRNGLGGRKFWIYKFRTMVVNADAMKAQLRAISEQDGPAFKLKNDPRVTPLGRLLRRTCLDELPQLINVLKGDMSLVGPRPLPCNEAENCNQWERQRLNVTPGLTCIWQVYGGTKVTFAEWMRMDLRYARARSLGKDFWLMAMTVPSVIKRNGVY